jgi:hypothetical protein
MDTANLDFVPFAGRGSGTNGLQPASVACAPRKEAVVRRIALVTTFYALGLCGADLSGNWPGMLQTGMGVDDHTLTLRHSSEALTGTVAFSNGKWEIRNARLEGEKLTFEVRLGGSSPWVLIYDLKVAGDEMTGAVRALDGPFPGGKLRFKRAR